MSYHIIELYVMTITAFLATTFIDCYGILNVLANLTFRRALLLQPITPCTKYTTVAKWIERIISYSTTSLYVYVTKMLNEFKDRNFTCIYGMFVINNPALPSPLSIFVTECYYACFILMHAALKHSLDNSLHTCNLHACTHAHMHVLCCIRVVS